MPVHTDPNEDLNDGPLDRVRAAKLLRSVWRIHFYAAFITIPFLLVEIITGLIIMYSGPIMSLLHGDTMRVEPGASALPLADLRAAADGAAPGTASLEAITMPKADDHATTFAYPRRDGEILEVYVNQYTGEVTGTHLQGQDVVGLANRLHGFLNVDDVTLPLPSLAHLIDPDSGPLIQDYVVGDLVLEIAAGWTIALAVAGLFLWWPRRSQKGKALLRPRLRKKGLIRWRDLHAVSGIFAIAALFLFLITGLPWSAYWGQTWGTVSAQVTPGDGPFAAGATSDLAKLGDLDRFGKPIPWAAQDAEIPTSGHSNHSGHASGGVASGDAVQVKPNDVPQQIDLNAVEQAAAEEGMLTGYSIYLPTNETTDQGTTFGSFTLMNYWPQSLGDERALILDQFSAKTLVDADSSEYGLLPAATELGITTHMGTQFGVLNTIWITVSCVLLLIVIVSSVMMWWIRRPRGSLGLPKRPASPAFAASVIGVTVALIVIYPLWGVTAVTVLATDKLLVQRVPALRRIVGMPPKTPSSS